VINSNIGTISHRLATIHLLGLQTDKRPNGRQRCQERRISL